MRLVIEDVKMLEEEVVDIRDVRVEFEFRKRGRSTEELDVGEGFNVVEIDMGVAQLHHQFVRLGLGDLRNHVHQHGIRRNVERQTQPDIGRPLIQNRRQSRPYMVLIRPGFPPSSSSTRTT